MPGTAELQRMAAQFRADRYHRRSVEAVGERSRVLAKLVEASKIMDALFLRQVWSGNEAMLLDLVRERVAGGPRAAALLPDQQGPWDRARSQPAVRRRRAAEAGGRQLLSGGREQGGARTLDRSAARGGARPRHRVLHGDPPRRGRRLHRSCRTASSTRAS